MISIIAILIAILLPATQRAIAVAEAAMCMSNQREVGRAILVYAEDWDGWAVSNHSRFVTFPTGHKREGEPLAPHFTVPLEELDYVQDGPSVPADNTYAPGHHEVFACPSRPRVRDPHLGRRFSSGIQIVGSQTANNLAADQRTPYDMAFADETWGSTIYSPTHIRTQYAPDPAEFPLIGDAWGDHPQGGANMIGAYRSVYQRHFEGFFLNHSDAANVWFLDGHVERLAPAGLAGINFWGAVNDEFKWIDTCTFVDDPNCTGPHKSP